MSYALIPSPVVEKLSEVGLHGRRAWDDGSDQDGMTKIYVRITSDGVQLGKCDYVKGGQLKQGGFDVLEENGTTHEILINHPEEYLVSLEVRCDNYFKIHGIKFKTNQKDSEYFGKNASIPLTLQAKDKKIIGLYGSSSSDGFLTSVGAYFVPKIPEVGWDDGKHAKVKRVQVTYDDDVIYSIHATYDGTALQSQFRGTVGPKSDGFTLESDEYITALSAYGKTSSWQDLITALVFITNKRAYGPYGNRSGFKISAREETGKQVAGFFGTSGSVLNSIYVHYAPIPAPIPAPISEKWDDGSDHDGVTKIYVRSGANGIQLVKFDYVKGENPKQGDKHGSQGSIRGSTREIVINHPEEYLVCVEGWYDSSNVIMGIQFKTNQKTYEHMGYDIDDHDTKFTLQGQDKKVIGFHGSSGTHLNSIEAYLVPITPQKLWKMLPGVGGDGGTSWNDGVFNGVKTVYVGQCEDGIAMVKFVYDKEGQVEEVGQHGKRTKQIVDEFKLDYPSEYITEVEGTYDNIHTPGIMADVITMLRFTTNKRRSDAFGIEADDDKKRITLKEEGHKIVGFHGSTSHGSTGDRLHKIGVYVLPITN